MTCRAFPISPPTQRPLLPSLVSFALHNSTLVPSVDVILYQDSITESQLAGFGAEGASFLMKSGELVLKRGTSKLCPNPSPLTGPQNES
jgi:hypothetical protein